MKSKRRYLIMSYISVISGAMAVWAGVFTDDARLMAYPASTYFLLFFGLVGLLYGYIFHVKAWE